MVARISSRARGSCEGFAERPPFWKKAVRTPGEMRSVRRFGSTGVGLAAIAGRPFRALKRWTGRHTTGEA
ncbi:MAG: hypothetical protein DI565_10060 [Ancylobacter novellus]|uniref:Uncharacterized protein n=1 Tax=Ancylobacter novellus TaxID=921 RepID=A0A2W5M8L6_ANCNO|nr:MAG: hypothetical protein DI565_10060 [Ancylobacter novellus]